MRDSLERNSKELSQALYQNDAALRVIARLAMERDAARQELTAYKDTMLSSSHSTTATVPPVVVDNSGDGPVTKRARTCGRRTQARTQHHSSGAG
jgi:pre-mRNA-processing factor 19